MTTTRLTPTMDAATPRPSLPAPYLQQEEFIRLSGTVDAIFDLPPPDITPTRRADPPDLFGAGPHDEYLTFGLTWWRYFTSGAAQFIAAGPVRDTVDVYACPALSVGACALGMSRTLLHASQLDDDQFAKTRDGMLRARHLAHVAYYNPRTFHVFAELLIAPWPPTTFERRDTHPLSTSHRKRRRIASKNIALVCGEPGVALHDVDHEYLLRLCRIQGAIDDLRVHTWPYDLPWRPPGFLDAATDVGSAWSAFYHCAMAYAVGGPAGRERLAEIGVYFDAETCLAGVANTHHQLLDMDPRDLPAAFASIDCADFYFDPAPSGR